MAAARRKPTIDERKEIVEYCLANGQEGLKENRGRRKEDEERSELEKLRVKRQLEDERRAAELLKSRGIRKEGIFGKRERTTAKSGSIAS